VQPSHKQQDNIDASMACKQFAQIPKDATLSFGGYTCIKPKAWENYLNDAIQYEYPDYLMNHRTGGGAETRWREQESCVLAALEKYLLAQFGLYIPEDNLFKIYNEEGEGLELDSLLEAVSAVIEPLGLEIDRALATDAEVRAGLGSGRGAGYSEKVIDGTRAQEVDGKPGICMINIEAGQSHAFFWRKIDPRGFEDERFRLVVLLRRKGAEITPDLSAAESAEAYLRFLDDYITADPFFSRRLSKSVAKMRSEMESLMAFLHDGKAWQSDDFRQKVDARLVSIIASFLNGVAVNALEDRTVIERAGPYYESGQMVRKVLREVESL
jgi:hypothetical protein